MGKIFVLSVTDHEEYILSRIMDIIAAEPEFDHIVSRPGASPEGENGTSKR